MTIEPITFEKYMSLIEWYYGWGLPITPFSYIPKNAFIVDDICAGFLYQWDNTPMFWVEGIISNPKIKDKDLKKKALSALIKKLEEIAILNGAELIITSTPRESLNEHFLKLGFKNAPENYFHLANKV
jgi:hypothetical protein